MCGICGIYDKGLKEINPDTVIAMRDVMVRRGPDDAGLYSGPHIGLGHRRLSIIDLSSSGHQPLPNEDEKIWIVFNGEIYNFPELREELEKKAHRFRSHTDTEVLVHGYEEWGIDGLLRRINGMFAFAIWDGERERLILARDRLGVKPLYYMERGGRVYFSSDIKSIYIASDETLTLDCEAIDHFLHAYCIPQEYSVFREIRKVLPSHYMLFEKSGTDMKNYWQLSFAEKEKMEEVELIRAVEEKLSLAVKRRMISDVPIGAFLSGGVDSSLVVALMAQQSGSPIRTFSMGVREESYNELKYARMVAERYATEHHEFIVEPDALSILPEIIWAYGEPFADSSQIPTYYISKLTREYVKVALTGDGGDESFGGYDSSLAYFFVGLYRSHIPAFLRNGLLPWFGGLVSEAAGRRSVFRRFKTFTEYGKGSFGDSLRMGGIFGEEFREHLYSNDFKRRLSNHDPFDVLRKHNELADGLDEVDRILYVDIKTALPNDYLTKVDVATMMNSLEARSPFLDYELIEFAARVPTGIKIKGGRQKYLLKKVADKHVPHAALHRKKWGFGIPVGNWFRGRLEKLLRETLLSSRARGRGYFNMPYVEQLLSEHLTARRDHSHRLWTLLCLELWHLMFIDKIMTSESLEIE